MATHAENSILISISEQARALYNAARSSESGKAFVLALGLDATNRARQAKGLAPISGFLPSVKGDSTACLLALALRVGNPDESKVSVGSHGSIATSLDNVNIPTADKVVFDALIDLFDDGLFPALECPLGRAEALARVGLPDPERTNPFE
jgi:hypothetical protein